MEIQVNEKLAYSVTEAAEALGVSRPTMYRFIRMEGFPVFRSGHIVRIPKKGLAEWLEKQSGSQAGGEASTG